MAHRARETTRAQPMAAPAAALEDFLRNTRFDPHNSASLGDVLRTLVDYGCDRAPFVPLPGHGQTVARWRALAAVAACDLGLVKLFEGHTDALAILAELGGHGVAPGSRWAVWAAEPPEARVAAMRVDAVERIDGLAGQAGLAERIAQDTPVYLTGTKAWCSGAAVVSHALVTAWLDDEPVLVAVAMHHPTIAIDSSKWQAIGMQATASADVHFARTPATLIGAAHAYVRRPGFWQGGAGIAACWYGAAAQIGQRLRESSSPKADAHRLAHLGAIDVALASAAAVLRETAAWIDANPRADAQRVALRARLVVEAAATEVMHHATRALGAGPLCRDARFARALADLPVFLRQSHAERDLAALGALMTAAQGNGGIDARVESGADAHVEPQDPGTAPWTL
ncbi:acyl-CoA dehydrogenase [Paraburkholderia sp. BL21I4N1]|uniref:acyl-CoA dehydrogenase n=1 Tax=Paraburkholderia sp. BL21I4N1 TaxID=1938801 RepID=UPI0021575AE3|nr:acyl-CoA dehydrogenase [Paraburkholderia sp. BL21I4N1]